MHKMYLLRYIDLFTCQSCHVWTLAGQYSRLSVLQIDRMTFNISDYLTLASNSFTTPSLSDHLLLLYGLLAVDNPTWTGV